MKHLQACDKIWFAWFGASRHCEWLLVDYLHERNFSDWKNSETHWTPEEVFWPKLSPTMVKAKPKHWKGSKALSWCIAWAPRFNRAARHQDPKHYASLCSTWWVLSGYKARMSTNRSNFSKNLAKVCKTQLLLVAMTMLDTGITELLQRGSQHW